MHHRLVELYGENFTNNEIGEGASEGAGEGGHDDDSLDKAAV